MKKRSMVALIAMIACLSACGGKDAGQATSDATTETQEASSEASETDAATTEEASVNVEAEPAADALDLTGQWVTESSDDGTMMVANIDGGAVSVFYIIAGDDTPWTYWVGTYDAPTTDKDSWSWTSNSTYTGNGLLASSDDTSFWRDYE